MGVTGNSLAQIAIFGREFQDCPRFELSNVRTVKLLPWRIVLQLRLLQLTPAAVDFFVADLNVHAPVLQIHLDQVARLKDRQIASSSCFR